MKKFASALLAILAFLVMGLGADHCTATAAGIDYGQLIQTEMESLDKITEELKSLPQEAWSAAAIEKYCATSLWLVYYGLCYYETENGRIPADLNGLAGTQFVPEWPLNPFNEWEPIRVRNDDTFSPGDMSLQICPAEFYSRINNPRPLSFELTAFGPSESFGVHSDPQPLKPNTWARVPAGALYMLGSFTETATQMQAKLEKWRREHPEDAGNHQDSGGTK